MRRWFEIRNDYTDTTEHEDIIAETCIDAWETPYNEEEGVVIAKVIKTVHGDVGVVYFNNMARVDEYAQEKIKEAIKDLMEE